MLNKDHPLASSPHCLEDTRSAHRAKPILTPQTRSREQGPDSLLSTEPSEELKRSPHAFDDQRFHTTSITTTLQMGLLVSMGLWGQTVFKLDH